MTKRAVCLGLICALVGAPWSDTAGQSRSERDPPWQTFLTVAAADDRAARRALQEIASVWRDAYTAMFIDIARLLPSPRTAVRTDEPDVRLDDDELTTGLRRGATADGLAKPPRPGALVSAYPKRILAWHELATETLGGVDIAIVYCTLCGTVIPYHTRIGQRRFTFGTSGLLYRSNKLLFDEETRTLWSSLQGIPVVGPLADSGIRLVSSAAAARSSGATLRAFVTATAGAGRCSSVSW
jgi:hypothetical protein